MKRMILYGTCWLALAAAGCKDAERMTAADTPDTPSASEESAADGQAPEGKPTAPIDIEYDVIGTPIVGQPVNIDLSVKSTRGDTPVRLSYRVLDSKSMSFPAAQAKEVALRVGDTQPAVRQVTIVPQREGRLYLNVTAEVETPGGAMFKSIAIPVQVGSGPTEQEPDGTLKEDAEGEAVLSLPADEN